MKLPTIPLLSFILLLPHFGIGAYAPLVLPTTWKFEIRTQAYDPNNPEKELGSFKKGIVVNVVKSLLDTKKWLVEYKAGSKPVLALIDIPDL